MKRDEALWWKVEVFCPSQTKPFSFILWKSHTYAQKTSQRKQSRKHILPCTLGLPVHALRPAEEVHQQAVTKEFPSIILWEEKSSVQVTCVCVFLLHKPHESDPIALFLVYNVRFDSVTWYKCTNWPPSLCAGQCRTSEFWNSDLDVCVPCESCKQYPKTPSCNTCEPPRVALDKHARVGTSSLSIL